MSARMASLRASLDASPTSDVKQEINNDIKYIGVKTVSLWPNKGESCAQPLNEAR